MNDTLKSFSFDVLLRNFFSGFFFLAAFYRAYGLDQSGIESLSKSLPALLTISLAVGLAVYALHRSLLNPIYDWLHCLKWIKIARNYLPLMCIEAVNMMVRRWDAVSEQKSIEAKRQKELKRWSDYIHFLYTSALSVLLGALLGWAIGKKAATFDPVTFTVGVTLFIGAVLSDWRRHYVEDHYLDPIPEPKKEAEQGGDGDSEPAV